MLFGLDSFGEVKPSPSQGGVDYDREIIEIVDQATIAEAVGIDIFGLGEHHRSDFCVSAPEMVLAAIATRTSKIRVSTAVTVLGADDPIRIYERFATLSALSGGRADIVVGRGAFIEAFPLFDLPLENYDLLFSEKLEILKELCIRSEVDWSGTSRAPLRKVRVFPVPSIHPMLSVGAASGHAILRAAGLQLPLVLPVLRGKPSIYRPHVQAYLRSTANAPHPLGVALHSPGHIASTDEEARERYWRAYRDRAKRLGRERGTRALSKDEFIDEINYGSMYVGSPETVANKIIKAVHDLGVETFRLKYSMAGLDEKYVQDAIVLFGSKVIPIVRTALMD